MRLLQVVNGHIAIIVAHDHQVGVVHMHVQTHDTTLAAEDVLREAWVLHAVEQQHAPALLHEIICPGRQALQLRGLLCQGSPLPGPHLAVPGIEYGCLSGFSSSDHEMQA